MQTCDSLFLPRLSSPLFLSSSLQHRCQRYFIQQLHRNLIPIAHFVWQSYLISVEQFKHWLATTDANVIFLGKPLGDLSDLSKRNALDTSVTYCNTQIDNVCGGDCTVYNGGPTCLSAPGTNCLFATNNVAFCNTDGCGGDCNQFSSCGVVLDNGFCDTPGTESILVGSA